jgi:hypothetical protein
MGLYLHLVGRYGKHGWFSGPASPDSFLAKLDEALRRSAGDALRSTDAGKDENGHPALWVSLHPAAERVQISGPSPGRIVLSAKTSGAGPGYHIFLCDLLHRLGEELKFAWDPPDRNQGFEDQTGHFHKPDASAVETHALSWLQNVASRILQLMSDDYGGIQISLPETTIFEHDRVLASCMGPRSLEWLEKTAQDPSRGIDLFPWWQAGQGAAYHLGRALSLMWPEIRWRPPLTDGETRDLDEARRHLESAYRLDPELDYPWREWSEMLKLSNLPPPSGIPIEARASESATAAPLVGFRRRNVRTRPFGQWSISVPGSFAENVDEDGTWSGWDESRTVWFSCISVSPRDGGPPPSAEKLASGIPNPESYPLKHRTERTIARAVIKPGRQEDRSFWELSGETFAPGRIGVSTIRFDRPEDEPWALSVWRSIDHPAS